MNIAEILLGWSILANWLALAVKIMEDFTVY